MESVIDEVIFIFGPPLVTFLCVVFYDASGLLLAAILVTLGGIWLSGQKKTQPEVHIVGAEKGKAALRYPGVFSLFLVYILLGAASRTSVDNTGPSRSNLVRPATGRAAAGLVGRAGENDGGEFTMLASLMGAPPLAGLEQHLRRKRPQGPGGCVKNPMRFACRSWPMYLRAEPACNAWFLSRALENLMKLKPLGLAFLRGLAGYDLKFTQKALGRALSGPSPFAIVP